MRHSVKLATAVFMFLAGSALAETSIDLPIPEARALATQAALGGEPETARRIAAALLQADPNDRAALLVLAAVEPQLGRPTQGRLAGARAYAVSVSDAEKYEAARLTALAAANEGRFTLAQWWLRRALTVAPTPADAAQTMTDARGVRNLNPWSSNVALSFAPSDNATGGQSGETIDLFGLPFSPQPIDRALSGWSGSFDLKSRYRLFQSETSQTELTARAFGRGVFLSQDALDFLEQTTQPGQVAPSNRDFSTALAEVGLSHRALAEAGSYGLEIVVGRAWNRVDISAAGQTVRTPLELDYSYFRFSADRVVTFGPDTLLVFAASAEQRLDEENDNKDDDNSILGWQTTVSHDLSNADTIGFTLSYSDTLSAEVNSRSDTWALRGSYAISRPLGPAKLTFTAGVQFQEYPDFRIFDLIRGRNDRRISVGMDAFFPDYSYAGFAPVITLSASRTDSNVPLFNKEDLSLSFTFRSTF